MRYAIQSEEQWLNMRKPRDNASDAAIFFGCGYKPPFQYWHECNGTLPREDLSNNERVQIGKYVQDGIRAAAEHKYGETYVPSKAYYTDDSIGELLGATPDCWLDHEDSDTVVEIKNSSWGQYKDDWILHEDGFVECPLRFQIQVQAQLACTGAKRGILIALVSGDRLVRCEMPRHEPAIAAIREKVVEFRNSITNGIEPPADMPGDYDTARFVWTGGGGQADMRGDARIESWLRSMAELRQTAKAVESDIKKIQGDVLAYCTSNGLASITADGGRISCKWREAKPAHERHFKAQPAHQELRITVP